MSADPFYGGLPAEVAEASEALAAAIEPVTVEPGAEVGPVELSHALVCAFKAKPCGACGKPKSNPIHRKKNEEEGKPFCAFKRRNGCAKCGRAKNDPDHLGAPESFNVFASGSWEQYQAAKQRWHNVLGPLLAASGLPRGLHRIVVEGEVSFGDDRARDQGNHRVVIEKALGDVLVEEGYLPADTWEHYEFGGLARREEPGTNRLRLLLFPQAPAPAAESVQGALL